MLGWLRPKCPLDTGEKMWTEFRMRWLAEKLGLDPLVGAEVILPEHRFFPDPYAGTPDDAHRIFDRVCGYMKLDPNRFDLEVLPGDAIPDAAGVYYVGERPRIVLASGQLSDPERLVATIAHELAHDILLGGGLITTDEQDHEHLTDLVPVFLGLGLFVANAPLRDRNHFQGGRHYSEIDQQGYLPSRMVGYALALFAFVRGETRPGWARYLRPDAADPFKRGLRYLVETGDSVFHPSTAKQPVIPPTEAEVVERLATGSPTVRAMTLCDVAHLGSPPVGLIEPIVRCLRDPDTDVRIEAARVLPFFGEAAQVAAPDLIECLASRSVTLRGFATAAIYAIGAPPDQVVPELTRMLEDPDSIVVDASALGLKQLAPFAASAVPALVEALRVKEINCHLSDAVADALIAINPPDFLLERLLDPIDPEIRVLVSHSLRTARIHRDREQETSTAAQQ